MWRVDTVKSNGEKMKSNQGEEQKTKLYKCQKCGKEVPTDDYNFFFKICYTCEKNSGKWN